jgi:hypothetical protein
MGRRFPDQARVGIVPKKERSNVVPRGTVLKWEAVPEMFHVEHDQGGIQAEKRKNPRLRYHDPHTAAKCKLDSPA